jgi:hypothetical protein
MKWRNISFAQLNIVVNKLPLELSKSKKRSPHPVYWYLIDGKKTLRVTLPNEHGGSGSITPGFIKQIRNSLKVNTRQFEGLVDCPLTSEEFEKIIRNKLGLKVDD